MNKELFHGVTDLGKHGRSWLQGAILLVSQGRMFAFTLSISAREATVWVFIIALNKWVRW
jgi:hypothetical protein